ncbi:MAG: hypothetical protein ACR2PA_03360 [Hyphomicrobiaceae bacterium]
MSGQGLQLFSGSALFIVAVMLSGCAGGPSAGGGMALSSGGSCKSIKRELGRYEARGVHMRADAAGRGKRLSSKQQAEVQRYNDLLNSYLSNQCHV